MERIVYISTARGPVSPAMTAEILRQSQRNNERDGLTGLLVVANRRFLQVIEGDGDALDRTYPRIKADPRHFALVQIERRPVAERSFPQWSMGCDEVASLSGATLEDVVARLTLNVADTSLKAHLRGFAELHSRAA